MAEEATDVAEITPEAFDGEETAKAESSPVEEAKTEVEADKTPEAAEPEAKAEKPAEEPAETETDGDEPADETETKPGKAEERKTQLNSEIRDLVSQRNALKTEVEKANAEVYQPATENELQDQGLSATDAKVEALRQQIEVKDYNDRVADAQLTISSEAERVLRDFPLFNSESKQYDKELANEAAQLLEANLILDPNTNQVIGSNVSPYQLYKTLARASGISGVKGQLKGQQDTEQMMANADTNSSAAPPTKAKDPVIALWEED